MTLGGFCWFIVQIFTWNTHYPGMLGTSPRRPLWGCQTGYTRTWWGWPGTAAWRWWKGRWEGPLPKNSTAPVPAQRAMPSWQSVGHSPDIQSSWYYAPFNIWRHVRFHNLQRFILKTLIRAIFFIISNSLLIVRVRDVGKVIWSNIFVCQSSALRFN